MSRRKTDNFLGQTPLKQTISSLDLRKSSNTPMGEEKKSTESEPFPGRKSELTKSYDTFYKNAFEEKGGANSSGVKELFAQQIGDDRSQYRMTLTPFLSNSARNISYFAKSEISFG